MKLKAIKQRAFFVGSLHIFTGRKLYSEKVKTACKALEMRVFLTFTKFVFLNL